MYEKAFVEVLEVIDHMENEMTNKIPSEVMSAIMNNADEDYKFIYDDTKSLEEQNISEDARIIISLLFIKYIADENERTEINKLIDENEKKLYDVFKKDEGKKILKTEEIKVEELQEENILKNINETVQMVKKEDKWYTKILNYIKNIFSKNN